MNRKLLSSSGKTKADLIDAVYRRHGALTKQEAAEAIRAVPALPEFLADRLAVGR